MLAPSQISNKQFNIIKTIPTEPSVAEEHVTTGDAAHNDAPVDYQKTLDMGIQLAERGELAQQLTPVKTCIAGACQPTMRFGC